MNIHTFKEYFENIDDREFFTEVYEAIIKERNKRLMKGCIRERLNKR